MMYETTDSTESYTYYAFSSNRFKKFESKERRVVWVFIMIKSWDQGEVLVPFEYFVGTNGESIHAFLSAYQNVGHKRERGRGKT